MFFLPVHTGVILCVNSVPMSIHSNLAFIVNVEESNNLVPLAGVPTLVQFFAFGDKMVGIEACTMVTQVTDLVDTTLTSSSKLIKAAISNDCQLVKVDLAANVRFARHPGSSVSKVHFLVPTPVEHRAG